MNIGSGELVFYVVVAVVFAVVTGEVGDRKGYSRAGFTVLGFLLGCIGLLVTLVLPNNSVKAAVMAGSLVRFLRPFPLDGGGVCPKDHASKVHDVDVKQGTPAALIDGPNGDRYWVPTSVLVPA